MDIVTYDQMTLTEDHIGDALGYLKENVVNR
jgi:translation elongation factor P/translation initiation factor 5A